MQKPGSSLALDLLATGAAGRWPVSHRAWACWSPADRAGDLDQVQAVAWALDPDYRTVELAVEFERLRRAHASGERPELPRFIVGIGSRRLAMAKAIRTWSCGRTRLIHIGRLRGSLEDLDYLITTPAYPLEQSPKVLTLEIALSDKIRRLRPDDPASDASGEVLGSITMCGIRPGWINVFLGNPLRGEEAGAATRLRSLAQCVDRLARRLNRDVVISGSPRTKSELYDTLSAALGCRHLTYRWIPHDPANPFELMLRATDCSIVTADSISMISQLVAAGHRTLFFPWRARSLLLAGVVPRWFGKPTIPRGKDIARFCAALAARGLAAEFDSRTGFDAVSPHAGIQDELFRRVREFVR